MFFADMAVGDSLSDIECSDNGEEGEDDDDVDTEHGKQSDVDKLGWVMSTISKPVQQSMARFWQKQMKINTLTQPGCGDAADSIRERDMKYGRSKFKVQVVV